jgi:hypothetical protein
LTEDNISPYLEQTRQALFDGDLEALAKYFVWPLVVYSPAGVLVVKDQDQFLSVSSQYLAALTEHAIDRGTCVILNQEPMQNRRTRVTAHWTELTADGSPVVTSTIRYFLLLPEDGLWRIEMLEYLEIPIPIETVERIIH